MRKIILGLVFAGGLVGAVASPASAAPPAGKACNRGTMRAHHVVPEHATQAHAHIPHCMMMMM